MRFARLITAAAGLMVLTASTAAQADPSAATTPAASAAATASPAASTALKPGATAPAVKLQSVVAGKTEAFDLQAAAAARPIVLYFFVKAFTSG